MIIAIIQARMGSTRLAGKMLADLHGKSLFERVVQRATVIPGVDRVVLATTTDSDDDVLADAARALGIGVHRGSVDDVLGRFAGAARAFDASVIVRVTADDPFKDPAVCGQVLAEFLRRRPDIDYVSNTLALSYPEGLDVEVFSRDALERAAREARLPSEREHVTPYIYNHPDRFRHAQVTQAVDQSTLRWTLDYPEDLVFARAVYDRLDRPGVIFGMQEMLDLLKVDPALGEINAGIVRNAGYLKSLEADAKQ